MAEHEVFVYGVAARMLPGGSIDLLAVSQPGSCAKPETISFIGGSRNPGEDVYGALYRLILQQTNLEIVRFSSNFSPNEVVRNGNKEAQHIVRWAPIVVSGYPLPGVEWFESNRIGEHRLFAAGLPEGVLEDVATWAIEYYRKNADLIRIFSVIKN